MELFRCLFHHGGGCVCRHLLLVSLGDMGKGREEKYTQERGKHARKVVDNWLTIPQQQRAK
jgi:hypothetical protein